MREEGSHRKQHPHANRKLVQFHPSPLYSSSNGAPPKARKPFSRHRKERFGILTKNRFAVGFARVAKYYAKDPTWREGGIPDYRLIIPRAQRRRQSLVPAMYLRRWAGRFNCNKGFDNL